MSELNDMKQLPKSKSDIVCAAGSENKTFWARCMMPGSAIDDSLDFFMGIHEYAE